MQYGYIFCMHLTHKITKHKGIRCKRVQEKQVPLGHIYQKREQVERAIVSIKLSPQKT